MGCPRMWVGWGCGGRGGEEGVQLTRIRLSGTHMGREFDTPNVPRVGNLTPPLSWKVKNGRTKLAF